MNLDRMNTSERNTVFRRTLKDYKMNSLNTISSKACMNRVVATYERTVAKEGKTSKEAQRQAQRLALNIFGQMNRD